MATRFGHEGKLYYLTTGNRGYWNGASTYARVASGTAPNNLAEIASAKDVTLKVDASEYDATARADRGFTTTAIGSLEISIECECEYNSADNAIVALIAAARNGTSLAVLALDQSVTNNGAAGVWFNAVVIGAAGRIENLKEGMRIPLTLKPAAGESIPPQFVTVVVA